MSPCTTAAFASWHGPDWLARLLLCPPGWLNPTLAAVAGIVGLVALLRLRQRGWELELDTQRSMLTIAATAAAVLVATLALVGHQDTSYLEDVVYGTLLGVVGVQVSGVASGRRRIQSALPTPEERLLAGWAGVAGLVAVASFMTSGGTATPVLRLGRGWLLALAGTMAIYNARELANR